MDIKISLTKVTLIGVVATGDVGGSARRLLYIDRTKDMVISGGFNVFPRG